MDVPVGINSEEVEGTASGCLDYTGVDREKFKGSPHFLVSRL